MGRPNFCGFEVRRRALFLARRVAGNANSTGTRLGQPCPPPRTLAHHQIRWMAGPSLDAKPPVMLDELPQTLPLPIARCARISACYCPGGPLPQHARHAPNRSREDAHCRSAYAQLLPLAPDGKIISWHQPNLSSSSKFKHATKWWAFQFDTAELQGKVKPSDRRVFWRERRVFLHIADSSQRSEERCNGSAREGRQWSSMKHIKLKELCIHCCRAFCPHEDSALPCVLQCDARKGSGQGAGSR